MLTAHRELSSLVNGADAYLPLPTGPGAATELATALGAGKPIDPRCALVVSTSGTTGTPKGAMHTADTLHASAHGTAAALGGPGSWLLALPPHHIAGLQVLLRSYTAGFEPAVLDLSAGFHPAALATAIAAMAGPRRYTSLVPLQLRKALSDPAATEALSELDAILVGGSATPPALAAAARAAGLRIIGTYGMSETAGGCVYDGIPLPGTLVRIVETGPDGVGRVELGGTTTAFGYRNLPDHPAFADPGWFRTDDLGVLEHGMLRIVGRADEAISTGGLTVVPQVVEAALDSIAGVSACVVFGVPDDRLGEAVAVAVVPAGDDIPPLAHLQDEVAQRLDKYAAPRHLIVVDQVPLRGVGKPDRRALRARFTDGTNAT